MTKREGKVGVLIFTLNWVAGFFSGIGIVLALIAKLLWFAMFFATLGILVMTIVAILYEQSRREPLPMRPSIVLRGKEARRVREMLSKTDRERAGNGVRHG